MSHFVDAMDQSAAEENLDQEYAQHEQQEQNAATRMATMERMLQDLQAQRLADQQMIANMQQIQQDNHNVINQHATTIDNLRNELQQRLNNPPVVAPPVAPAVAPAVAPMVAPMIPAPANDTEPEMGKTLKAGQPNKFDGDTAKLRQFLDDLLEYFEYYFPKTFPENDWEKRIRYAGTRMEGAAADWFKTILKDKKNDPAEQNELTKDVFKSYDSFEEQLEKCFGITNEAQEAEKKLRTLKQKGPCYKHTSTFIQLLSKVNWTEDSKKEMYYYSLKPEVKDEIYKTDRQKVTFTALTQEAIAIDNRQWERKQERKDEKNGQPTKHQPQANQGKKREDYVAKDNGTRPGRMDIDTINHRKFPGTCNACGKKGHKEADCRSKMTCGFCGKKGHDEAHCYTKKNTRKSETTKDKVQIDAIMEVPHDHLSWTACYNDSCLVHKSSKEGSGYYPKKPRAKKSHETVRIDTLNFYEKRCEDCSSTEPCSAHALYECSSCGSWNINHTCENNESRDKNEGELSDEKANEDEIVYDEDGRIHECSFRTTDKKHQQWINTLPDTHPFAKYKETLDPKPVTFEDVYDSNDSDDDECHQCGALKPRHDTTCPKYTGDYGCPLCMSEKEKHKCTGCVYCKCMKIPHFCDNEIRKKNRYECEICESKDLDHDCNGCKTCGSWDLKHDCSEILDALVREHRRQEERRQYLEEHPPVRINLPTYTKIDVSQAYDYITVPESYHPSRSGRTENYGFNKDCGKENWMLCDTPYCGTHVHDKLEDWHDQQIENQLFKGKCIKEHFLDCTEIYCTEHVMIKHRFRLLTRALTKKGYNTITHEHKGQGSKALIKEFHSMIEERIHDIKCKWCYKYQGTKWRESHLGRINIDSIGHNNKKLLVEGYINQHPVTTYVDSGADRNLITPQMVNLLGLPYAKKKQPTYVSSVATPNAETTINYETDHLPITIAGHTETIKFDIMNLDTCDVLLGHPWLKQGNPLINWKTEEILWETDVTQEL